MLKKYNEFINEGANTKLDEIASMIDYTELDVNTSEEQLYNLAQIATDLDFATMCVRPTKVKYLRGVLDELNSEKGSDVGITTVVSFPYGTDTLQQKKSECEQCIRDGADEVDMVLNYQELKKNEFIGYEEYPDDRTDDLTDEVSDLVEICHKNNKILKVIVESGKLTPEETRIATMICIDAGADFIKTSTGMIDVGAEIDKVKIFKDIIKSRNSDMKIKASGGIRTEDDVMKFLQLVDRFGIGYGSVNNIFDVEMGGGDSNY